MFRTIARFEKVSWEEFYKDFKDCNIGLNLNDLAIKQLYNNIKLPARATKGSAGYDFYSPIAFVLAPGETIKIPTGIRVKMKASYFLACYPRSGLGFKYRLQLNNTVGIIDSDYYNAKNEGHIFAKLTNDSNERKMVSLKEGEAFMQGIFQKYYLATEQAIKTKRTGGLGSTSKGDK